MSDGTQTNQSSASRTQDKQAGRKPAALDGTRLIAIGSGKGGVGKTWFSITFAHCLALQGKKVLLFDGDLGLANVDIQLGLMPERDLAEVVSGKLSMKRAVTPYREGGFDILAGRSGGGALASLPPPRLLRLRQELATLSKDYDHVIIDLAAGVDKTVQLLAGIAAHSLLVVNDEPTSLTDGYAFIKLAHQGGAHKGLKVVVNSAESQTAGRKTYDTLGKACQNFLGFTPPLAGVVRRDAKVRDSIRAQSPLMTRSPDAQAGGDVERIVAQLLL